MPPASYGSTAFTPDKLVTGPDVLETRQITLITGQNLARGALLGKITASGKYNLSLSAAVDGSQVPDAILGEATDASGADKVTIAYFRGGFNETEVVLGAAHTVDTVREGLRGKGVVLRKALNP